MNLEKIDAALAVADEAATVAISPTAPPAVRARFAALQDLAMAVRKFRGDEKIAALMRRAEDLQRENERLSKAWHDMDKECRALRGQGAAA